MNVSSLSSGPTAYQPASTSEAQSARVAAPATPPTPPPAAATDSDGDHDGSLNAWA